jgi:RNA polymerase sigma factor (sigma-70 family)
MDLPSHGSVSTWLAGLKGARDDAAQELWNRYFAQLIVVARRNLRGMTRDVDEEDVALSALKSAMLGVQNNRFPDLADRTELWPLLVTITARKALNEVKRQRTKKRDSATEQRLADIELVIGADPSPGFAAQLEEAIHSLVEFLGDDSLQLVARQKLEGWSNDEIAQHLGVSTRTVVRKLTRIRQEWDEWQQV